MRHVLRDRFEGLDRTLTHLAARHGVAALRVSLGLVYIWFGALKLLPDAGPAAELVRNTVYFVDPDIFIPVLAMWEIAIGVGLAFGVCMRLTLLLLILHLPGTALPLILLPEVVWTRFPFSLTMEGQYIVKNLVTIGATLVLAATLRGGGLVAEARDAAEVEHPTEPTTSADHHSPLLPAAPAPEPQFRSTTRFTPAQR